MTSTLTLKGNYAAFWELVLLLRQHSYLTLEMAKREIIDRYLGQVFGISWILGYPLVLMAVYIFVFVVVFKVKIGGTPEMPLDYATYLLSGLIPWLAFQDSMTKASTAIIGNATLVKEVVFPIEVLPVKGVIASLVSQVIFLFLLTIYILMAHHFLPWTYVFLPFLILVQALAMIGVSYALSAIGVYFRDVKDIVLVFNLIGLYLMPAFYLPEFVPEMFRFLLYLNPFSYLIWCYQDVLYFGRFEHWWAWGVLAVMSLGVFILGYRIFRKLKIMFGNVL